MPAITHDMAQKFELSSEEVTKIAKHSVKRMSMLRSSKVVAQSPEMKMKRHLTSPDQANNSTDDLLACDGATQIPSYVTKLPTGSETGQFLAVDLGGTHCRVCLVDLQGDSTYKILQTKHVIPKEHMVNPSHKPLFNFIASIIQQFLDTNSDKNANTDEKGHKGSQLNETCLKLAFTFSFTYKTISLAQGQMLQWDKGWDIPDAIGQDPCNMLQQAIDKLGLQVNVVALTSDSVSTLVAEAYTCKGSMPPLAGIIFGTGTNAAYVERLENITKLHKPEEHHGHSDEGSMVINSEWGAWYDEYPQMLPHTHYDKTLDKESTNPNEQLFEKRVSGMYLAELMRLTVLKATEDRLLTCSFDSFSPLYTAYSLSGSLLSSLAEDSDDDLNTSMRCIMETLKARDVSRHDAELIRSLSVAIVRRAARLSGAAIAALIMQSGRLCHVAKPTDDLYELKELKGTRTNKFLASCLTYVKALFCQPTDSADDSLYSTSDRTDSLVPENEIITIGVDGSLFEFYPTFEADIRGALRDISDIGPAGEERVRFRLTRDGSSLGAALVAHAGL